MSSRQATQVPANSTNSYRTAPAKVVAPARPSMLFQRSLGNQVAGILAGGQVGTTNAWIGQLGDRYEKEADAVASDVAAGMPSRGTHYVERISRLSRTGGHAKNSHGIQRKNFMPGSVRQSAPGLSSVRNCGRLLQPAARANFEARFGTDFESIRIHSDSNAARLADSLKAKAFMIGSNIVFGKGQYAPDTASGKQLLAHELTHNIQQVGAVVREPGHERSVRPDAVSQAEEHVVVQRQPSGEIGANDIFPFAERSLVLLTRAVPDWIFALMSRDDSAQAKQVVAALRALEGTQGGGTKARVVTSTADLFVATAISPITIPAVDETPARTVRDLTVRMSRAGGSFTFSVTGVEGQGGTPTPLMQPQSGLTASRSDASIVLSSEEDGQSVRRLRVLRQGDDTIISVFTANIAPRISSFYPELTTISISQLQAADENSDVEAATNRIISRQVSRRRTRRQQFTLGGGATLIGSDPAGLARASWMYRFPTTGIASWFTDQGQIAAGIGEHINIPLEVQILYAPPSSLLGTLSTGIGGHIPLTVPVNVSLFAGVGGGSVLFPTVGDPERRPVFGPTLGGEAGIELGNWRVNVRADHLFNRVVDEAGNRTGISTFSGNVGGVF